MWNKTISDHTIYLFRKLWFLCLASPAQLFKTSPHPNVQDSESTTSDFVTVVITAMTNLVDHFLTTSSAKLQRIDVQKAMLACNHLSRQCNKSLGDIDAFHMPHPRVSATTPAKRTQVQMPPAHHGVSEAKHPRLAQDGPDDNPHLAEGQQTTFLLLQSV